MTIDEIHRALEASTLDYNVTDEIMALLAITSLTAHWTKDFTCSYCGCKCYPMDIDFGDYNYCPNCGAKMKEGE